MLLDPKCTLKPADWFFLGDRFGLLTTRSFRSRPPPELKGGEYRPLRLALQIDLQSLHNFRGMPPNYAIDDARGAVVEVQFLDRYNNRIVSDESQVRYKFHFLVERWTFPGGLPDVQWPRVSFPSRVLNALERVKMLPLKRHVRLGLRVQNHFDCRPRGGTQRSAAQQHCHGQVPTRGSCTHCPARSVSEPQDFDLHHATCP